MWQCERLQLLRVASFLFIVMILPTNLTSSIPTNVILTDVITNIDLSSQLVNIQHKISLISENSYLRSFNFFIDPSLVENLSYISADGKNVDSNIPLVHRGNGRWELFFERPVIKRQKEVIVIQAVFSHVLKPYPTRIKQNEKHLVLYSGPISFLSSYLSLNHTSFIKLGNGNIESISKLDEFVLTNKSPITFVSESPIQPNTRSSVKIHFEHKNPFLIVRELYRTIEISHWGSIKVIEEILLENNGATFYGPYHRQLFNDKGTNKIMSFTTALPASAIHISVYDDIGLISSRITTTKEDCIEMELYPRFVLYGGWKIKYTVSYVVPSYEYLYHDYNQNYLLKMRMIDHIFNDMVIDEATVKIILPEGTEELSLKPPYPVQHFNDTYHVSYLDTIGKPVITFSKTNLVEEHIQDFVLNYKFIKFKMLLEPFYIIAFIQLIFISVIISLRLDFRISKEDFQDDQKLNYGNMAMMVKTSSSPKAKKKRH